MNLTNEFKLSEIKTYTGFCICCGKKFHTFGQYNVYMCYECKPKECQSKIKGEKQWKRN